MSRIFVGMSGGVDSSLTAALLVEAGHDVVGVYMKNWTQDLPGMKCPWADDLADAKRVAVQLGIPFKVYDFQSEYKKQVVDYMVSEYSAGRTPNPDVMCNQEVKFKLFYEAAKKDGAELIATGHYARTKGGELYKAKDENKDQTYFLYRASTEALVETLFPLGDYTKQEVRELARSRGIVTAEKKDSQGICFVGSVGVRDFLSQYVETEPGEVVDVSTGETVGEHEGAIYYTLGQRHGMNIGGGMPYYVVGKDMSKNEVHVSRDLNEKSLWRTEVELSGIHWIQDAPKNDSNVQVRMRHRGELRAARIVDGVLYMDEPERAVAPGQSAVIYSDDKCLGGGFVAS